MADKKEKSAAELFADDYNAHTAYGSEKDREEEERKKKEEEEKQKRASSVLLNKASRPSDAFR